MSGYTKMTHFVPEPMRRFLRSLRLLLSPLESLPNSPQPGTAENTSPEELLSPLESLPNSPDLFRIYRHLLRYPTLERKPGGWQYEGRFYPDYLTVGGASQAIFGKALAFCRGRGIDVGAGLWPLPGSIPVDIGRGPGLAHCVSDFASETLDYVFSSHCLEHVENWRGALAEWIGKLKAGGKIFLYLPHPDCAIWRPGSPFIGDGHKWTPTPDAVRQFLRDLHLEIIDSDDGPDVMQSFFVCGRKRAAGGCSVSKYAGLTGLERGEGCPATAGQMETDSPKLALGSAPQLAGEQYVSFMNRMNEFASRYGMRVFLDWSKIWEYPWLWFNALGGLQWSGLTVVDLGSELSPMPWFLASLGARVQLVEMDAQWVPRWIEWRRTLGVDVEWKIVDSEALPIPDASADVVTSFSVIEHQPGKAAAVEEAVRILKPGGLFAVSFDICEPEMGMTFPAWNGEALTMREFEQLLWFHPAFGNRMAPVWNTADIPAFLEWHRKSAPHHNYVVGAAVLRRMSGGPCDTSKRLVDLGAIRKALAAYHQAHGTYPKSSGGWDGLYTNWGVSTSEWIPGLVPEYLAELPRDPRNSDRPEQQYLYISDGQDYKLISHLPEDIAAVRQTHPELTDPVRDGWAYGFWTDGAAGW
jgi:SAM-dependent methyltransferase